MIDISTLFVVSVLTDILIAIILTIVGRRVDSSLLYCAAGYALNGMAYVMIALRGAVPDIFSVWLANILVAATYSFYVYGLLRFLKRPVNSTLALLIWGPVLVIAGVFPLFADNLEARIVTAGLVNAFQAVLLLSLLVQNNHQTVGRGKYILMTAFAAGVVIALSRPVALTLGLMHISAVDSPGLWQSITFVPILLLNVTIALGLVLMQKEQAEAATSAMARSDELTGLPNRRRIYECINETMLDCKDHQVFAALLLIDLDHFKAVNDQHGHAVGDDLLCQAARRIRENMTIKDTAARLGGDEFVVLLGNLTNDYETATRIALERAGAIRQRLDEQFVLIHGITHRCSGSIGITIIRPGAKDRESLLKEADHAMYKAKNSDKGSIVLAQPAPAV